MSKLSEVKLIAITICRELPYFLFVVFFVAPLLSVGIVILYGFTKLEEEN
jgi:nitrate reductase NapE component